MMPENDPPKRPEPTLPPPQQEGPDEEAGRGLEPPVEIAPPAPKPETPPA